MPEPIIARTGLMDIGPLELASGQTMAKVCLSWKTFGKLAPARDNVILYPTSFAVQHTDVEWLVGAQGVLDPARWFVVIVDMLGNGLSSSPSNDAFYPALVTAADNARAQHRLLQHWGIDRLACVYGWSMGAQQAYHWAAHFPDMVERVVINCGSARTAVHNRVFLESLIATLEAAPQYDGHGRFSAQPKAALRAFGRIYAAWALSQDFYRQQLHLSAFGARDLEDYLATNWDGRFANRHPANLLAHLRGWHASDISANPLHRSDLAAALRTIKARVLLMPGSTDLYFRAEDNEDELAHLSHAALRPIPSVWGHLAGNPQHSPQDRRFIATQVMSWLAQ